MQSSYEKNGGTQQLPLLRSLLENASIGGLVLVGAALLALLIANSPLAETYNRSLHSDVGSRSVLHWINDGLMALFFLMVGLEIKREMLEGELSTWSQRVLPGCAALGGMIVPALVFLALNSGETGHLRGWAIPAATDIAFALGVLSLLGSRVPMSLRVFLVALAILDDLGAILIIAFFYADQINSLALVMAALFLIGLIAMNHLGVIRLWPYLILGGALWFLVLQSGIHATLASVALALTIPLRPRLKNAAAPSPLHILEHGLQPWVTLLIVPIFGFANAGVSLMGISLDQLARPVPLGIILGLFIGKQVGVFTFSAAVILMGWAKLPDQANWKQFYGLSLLCGIGFTMSLFIGLLAFPTSVALQDEVKVGVLLGSTLSALGGVLLLWRSKKNQESAMTITK